MWTENLCGANLSYYEMCERNVKVWIPFIPWDSQLCMLWLTQTKKITNLKLFDMCMWTKLSTKITNTILNNFPYLPYGIFWGMKPPTRIFLRLALASLFEVGVTDGEWDLVNELILMEGGVRGHAPRKICENIIKIALKLVHSERFWEYKFQPHQGISRIINWITCHE